MVIWQRTIQVAQGKRPEALDWAKRHTNWLRGKYPKHNFRLTEELLGDHTVFHWFGDFDSLAAWESYQDKVVTETEWQNFGAEMRKNLLFTVGRSVSKGYKVILG